ncbi:MAG: DUF4252 domain-containing protein [Muribaculaceae bacterium]|nr:DUF4252 domain-containing protein [Muribaculaceae bacterium]
MNKYIIRVLVFVLVAFAAIKAAAQTKIFKEAAAIEGVTSVYISPSLLNLGADIGMLGYGLDDAVVDLNGLEVITSTYSLVDRKKVKDLCNKVIDSLGTELLIDINEEGENVRLFAELDEGSPYAKQMVLEIDEPKDNYTVIYIRGKIDMSKIIKDNLRFK